jgi:hypothetical protein
MYYYTINKNPKGCYNEKSAGNPSKFLPFNLLKKGDYYRGSSET